MRRSAGFHSSPRWFSAHRRQRKPVNLRLRIAELRQDGEVVLVRSVEHFDTDIRRPKERRIAVHHLVEQAGFLRAGDEKARRHAGADQVDRIPLLIGFDGEPRLLLEAGRGKRLDIIEAADADKAG
jgi:hypothetical protein